MSCRKEAQHYLPYISLKIISRLFLSAFSVNLLPASIIRHIKIKSWMRTSEMKLMHRYLSEEFLNRRFLKSINRYLFSETHMQDQVWIARLLA